MEKHFRLPKEFAEKWLAALRSGKYNQTNSVLCKIDPFEDDNNSYCCLGVGGSICNVSNQDMAGKELPDDIFIEKGYAKELVQGHPGYSQELEVILTNLNDCDSFKDFESSSSSILNIVKGKVVFHKKKGKYSFEDIAQFIEDNCEFY